MAGRGEELKGSVKEGLGKLTGDESMEAEGEAQQHAGRTERKTSGAMSEAGGKLKEAAGKLTDSERMEAEGKAEQLKGRAERA